jgi:YbgC/YbaW family acyl-CoA thioester hydrolase
MARVLEVVMGATHAETYRVAFGDSDAVGVVFYPNYYRWFDRMTHELFRSIGHPLTGFMPTSQAPVVAEAGCRFQAATRYDDILGLTATVTEVHTRSFRVEHEVRRSGDLVASGFEVRIWVVIEDGIATAVPIPNEVAERLRSTG